MSSYKNRETKGAICISLPFEMVRNCNLLVFSKFTGLNCQNKRKRARINVWIAKENLRKQLCYMEIK
jgi:hypothetical protein